MAPGEVIGGWELVAMLPWMNGTPTAVFEKNVTHQGDILYVTAMGEHPYEFHCVKAIGLRPPLAAVDLDARGVDDLVLNSLGQQKAMEPETVASRLVATRSPEHPPAGRTASWRP